MQQLEYIGAVDVHRHFVTAAERCFVTQATLSMMIKKLEDELEVKIFDRSKQPVVPTEIGKLIIAQAKKALQDTARIKEIVNEERGLVRGELKVGIIPTPVSYTHLDVYKRQIDALSNSLPFSMPSTEGVLGPAPVLMSADVKTGVCAFAKLQHASKAISICFFIELMCD